MTGSAGIAAVVAGVDRVDHPLEHLGRCQRARGVVDEHDLDVAPQRPESVGDGLLSSRPAGHHRDQVPAVARGLERIRQRIALTAVRRDDDDLRERPREDAAEGMPQDAVPVDADERLGSACRESRAGSGSDDDDGDARDGRRFRAASKGTPSRYRPSGLQEARTSSRMTPACSSSVFSASASSEIRICLAFASMRFSPAERPRS